MTVYRGGTYWKYTMRSIQPWCLFRCPQPCAGRFSSAQLCLDAKRNLYEVPRPAPYLHYTLYIGAALGVAAASRHSIGALSSASSERMHHAAPLWAPPYISVVPKLLPFPTHTFHFACAGPSGTVCRARELLTRSCSVASPFSFTRVSTCSGLGTGARGFTAQR